MDMQERIKKSMDLTRSNGDVVDQLVTQASYYMSWDKDMEAGLLFVAVEEIMNLRRLKDEKNDLEHGSSG